MPVAYDCASGDVFAISLYCSLGAFSNMDLKVSLLDDMVLIVLMRSSADVMPAYFATRE